MGEGAGGTGRLMRRCRKCARDLALAAFEEYRPGYRRHVCGHCANARRAARRAESEDSADRRRGRAREAARTPDERAMERERLRVYGRSAAGRAARRRKPSRRSDRVNARNRAYRAANRAGAREQSRQHMRLRRAGYDAALVAWTDVLVADPCAYCGGESTGVDHVVALSAGGANEADNLVGACFDCNRRKRTQPLLLHLAGC